MQLSRLFKLVTPIFAITAVVLAVGSAQAAPLRPSSTSGGLYAGTFEGYLTGDNGSQAPVSLELTQVGRTVTGTIDVEEGLYVDGGNCGAAAVPAGSQTASGQVSARNPRLLDDGASFTVQGIKVNVDLDAELSANNQSIEAVATVDLPWLCGHDPVVSGEFTRVQ